MTRFVQDKRKRREEVIEFMCGVILVGIFITFLVLCWRYGLATDYVALHTI